MRQKIWGMDSVQTLAMVRGIEEEGKAGGAYAAATVFQVNEAGL